MRFAFALLACMSAGAYAQLKVTVNGEPVIFSGTGPQKIDGRVMVPLRGVMEKIGAFVGWDGPTKTVRAQKGDIDLSMVLGSRFATVNGRSVTLDVPAQQILGVTMVPLRFMGETLGAEINYVASTETIEILLPNGSGSGTTPPTNPPTNPPTTPPTNGPLEIRGFDVRAPQWVKAGDAIDFTLTGTPGAQATVIVNGIPNEIPLREGPAGVYTARWIATADKSLQKTTVLGRLKMGTADKLIQSSGTISIDTSVPMIKTVSPSVTAKGPMPEITATYSDEGSGIDPKNVRLMVGNTDVTAAASIHPEFLLYRPSRAMTGNQTVTLHVTDDAGNHTMRSWSFMVDTNPTDPGTGAGAPAIKLFLHSARTGAVAGTNINFRIDTVAGAKIVINAGSSIMNFPMNESPGGIYRGAYMVKATDRFNNDPVYADITLANGQRYRIENSFKIPSISTSKQVALAITSHRASDQVNGTITLKGTAPVGTKVNIRIDYATSVGPIKMTGLVNEETVEVDKNGNWVGSATSLDTLVKGKDTEYRITVTSTDGDGKVSSPVNLTLKKS